MAKKKIILNIAFSISNPLHDQILKASLEFHKKYGSEWLVDDKKIFLHLTLFLMAAPAKNRRKIIAAGKKFARQFKPATLISSGFSISKDGLIMLDFKPSAPVYRYHCQAIELFNPLREGMLRDKYEDKEYFGSLSQKEKSKILKYGHRYVLNEFLPHISIGFVELATDRRKAIKKYKKILVGQKVETTRFQIVEAFVGPSQKNVMLLNVPLSSRGS